MKYSLKNIASLLLSLHLLFPDSGQSQAWDENDRQFLLDNLERTRDEMIKETNNLTLEQWSFKEKDDTWSIAQVVEHMGIYERTFLYEGLIILQTAPEPDLLVNVKSDSVYLAWMNDPLPHKADQIHTPLGFMKGKDNLTWFLYGRDLVIDFIRDSPDDLKGYYTYRGGEEKRRSLHGLYVVHFGHTDRHLRQIRRIKQNYNYPQ